MIAYLPSYESNLLKCPPTELLVSRLYLLYMNRGSESSLCAGCGVSFSDLFLGLKYSTGIEILIPRRYEAPLRKCEPLNI
jgi:hypothetical protein